MTKKTRLIILLICVACFLIIAPVLVLYSMGYRFDFVKMRTTATGGIYVRTFPTAGQVIIDSKIIEKPGMFSNSIFVQSLLPTTHSVLIKKNDYYDYFKTLPVQENQVTKLENVLLIKKNIEFSDLADKIDYFSIAPNNQNIITTATEGTNAILRYYSINSQNQSETFSIAQIATISDIKWSDDSSRALISKQYKNSASYYLFDGTLPTQSDQQKSLAARMSFLDINTQQISFNPQNSQELFFVKNKILYSEKNNEVLPIISGVITYKISGSNIVWLSSDGLLYNSDIFGKLIGPLTTKNIKIVATQSYKIFMLSGRTFLQANNSLFSFNQDSKLLEDVTPPETNYIILASPDSKNLIFWNSAKIYLYSFTDKKYNEIFSGGQINICQWMNNDYIVFTVGNKITISEIDYRGDINAVTLQETPLVSLNKKIQMKNPVIFFNRQDGKLYVLTDNTLLASEKIIP